MTAPNLALGGVRPREAVVVRRWRMPIVAGPGGTARNLRDRTEAPLSVGMRAVVRETNRLNRWVRVVQQTVPRLGRIAVPRFGGRRERMLNPPRYRAGVALLLGGRGDRGPGRGRGLGVAQEDELDVFVIVVVVIDDVTTIGARLTALAVARARPRREADQEQRGDDPEQRDERGQQHRLRHR